MERSVHVIRPAAPGAEAAARADVYAVLAVCFAPPTDGLLEAAATGALGRALRDALATLPPGWEALEPAVAAFEALPPRLAPDGPWGKLESLQVEYARLFVGPGLAIMPPYESVHVEREKAHIPGQLWGRTTYDVIDAYEECGLFHRRGPEPPDHLAAELEFMAFASEMEALALEGGDRREAARMARRRRAFLADHLRRWGHTAAAQIVASARHPLYGAAGLLLRAVLAADV